VDPPRFVHGVRRGKVSREKKEKKDTTIGGGDTLSGTFDLIQGVQRGGSQKGLKWSYEKLLGHGLGSLLRKRPGKKRFVKGKQSL